MHLRYASLALTAGLAAFGHAIVPNITTTDFQSVVRVTSTNAGGTNGSGTAINPFFVLTAKHVGGNWVQFGNAGSGGQTFQAVERIVHPTADLALLRFSTALPTFTSVFFGDNMSQTVTVVGYGSSGVLRGDNTGYDITLPSGTRRSATNVIDSVYTITASDNFGSGVTDSRSLLFDLDGSTGNGSMGAGAVAGEGSIVSGDSGGAAFRLVSGEHRLIGVNSFVWSVANDGDFHDFGDGGGVVDLNHYQSWITANAVPEPGTMLALVGGLAALASRRRSKKS